METIQVKKGGKTVEISVSALADYEARGFSRVDEPESEKAKSASSATKKRSGSKSSDEEGDK